MDYFCLTVDGQAKLSWLAVPPLDQRRPGAISPWRRSPTPPRPTSSVARSATRRLRMSASRRTPAFRLDTPTKRVLGKLQDLTNALPMKGFLCFDAAHGFLAYPR